MRLFFPVYGVNLAYGLPTTFSSTFTCPQASSLQSPFFLISSFNTSLHLFLGLPFTPLPSTCSVSILFIQHNSSLLSTWPNHINLFHRMTSAMSSIASMLLTHSLLFLSLKLTPVIHLNILISLLCIFLISSIFVSHVSLTYNIAGLMHVVQIIPFDFRLIPFPISRPESSLNFNQSVCILFSIACSQPSSWLSMSPK